MDQYLLILFLVGWTSIYQLFWGSLGTRVLTHPHMCISLFRLLCTLSYYIVLFFIIFQIVWYYIMLYYIVWYYIILYYIIVYFIILHYITLFIYMIIFCLFFFMCISTGVYVHHTMCLFFCRYSALVCGEKQSSVVWCCRCPRVNIVFI